MGPSQKPMAPSILLESPSNKRKSSRYFRKGHWLQPTSWSFWMCSFLHRRNYICFTVGLIFSFGQGQWLPNLIWTHTSWTLSHWRSSNGFGIWSGSLVFKLIALPWESAKEQLPCRMLTLVSSKNYLRCWESQPAQGLFSVLHCRSSWISQFTRWEKSFEIIMSNLSSNTTYLTKLWP